MMSQIKSVEVKVNDAGNSNIALDDLVLRARELVPLLEKNAVKTEQDRRAHQENIDAIQKAGLFKLMVPKRYGGYQGTIKSHLDITSVLAEGCASTAWVVALTNVCAWFTSLFCEQAQNDVFGANGNARVSGVFTPSPDTKQVDGGLIASGKWYWSSGCLHADWAILGVLEKDSSGAVIDQHLALIPMNELTIEDTWYTAGMKGTGSNCIVGKDVFIPRHRLLPMPRAVIGEYQTEHKEEAEYRAALIPAAALILIGAQLGIGRAALKYVIDKAPQRAISYTFFQKQSDSTAFQLQIADAALKIDTAHLHAYRAAADIDNAAKSGVYMDYVNRARCRADTGVVAKFIPEAIGILVSAHGAGSFADVSPMQRYWRDSNTAARHAIAIPETGFEVYGKALLNVEHTVTALV